MVLKKGGWTVMAHVRSLLLNKGIKAPIGYCSEVHQIEDFGVISRYLRHG